MSGVKDDILAFLDSKFGNLDQGKKRDKKKKKKGPNHDKPGTSSEVINKTVDPVKEATPILDAIGQTKDV